MLDITREVYRTPEILKGMDLVTTNVVKRDIEKILERYKAKVDELAKVWEDDYNTNSHGNEWYWSPKFENLNNVVLAKGVWDQILVCVNAHLAGEL